MNGNERRTGVVLQERDRHLLRELTVLRVADRELVKTVAGFGSTTRVNLRLLALTRAGLLRRFFLGTNGGGSKALYALSAKGAHLVGVPQRGPRRRENETLAADFFVQHQLAVNEIYAEVRYKALPPGVAFGRWVSFFEPLATGLRLIPDGYFELHHPTGTLAAFLEVDLGNEHRKVWAEKVKNYLQLALSGNYERKFSQTRFRALVLANSERRVASLRKVVAASTEKIFWFRTLESVHQKGFFAPLWLRPVGDDKRQLLTPIS